MHESKLLKKASLSEAWSGGAGKPALMPSVGGREKHSSSFELN
jgi:hypothetical protein